MDGRTDGRMDGRTEFLPFYRTSSPVGPAALLRFVDFTTSKRQGKGTADLLDASWRFILKKACNLWRSNLFDS